MNMEFKGEDIATYLRRKRYCLKMVIERHTSGRQEELKLSLYRDIDDAVKKSTPQQSA